MKNKSVILSLYIFQFLQPEQLKALESLVDEEFVYSKRQNKNRLKALLKEADERRAAEEMDQE